MGKLKELKDIFKKDLINLNWYDNFLSDEARLHGCNAFHGALRDHRAKDHDNLKFSQAKQ